MRINCDYKKSSDKMKKRDKKSRQINYKAFLPIGVTFMGAGVVFLTDINKGVGAGLIILGAVYLILGAKHKNK